MKSNIIDDLRKLAIDISTLQFDAANARKHNPKNIEAIKSSLAQFGQRKPIVVQRDGMIVRAGNGTLEAARALGWSEIAAVVIDEDGTKAAQFAIADNRTAELAEWDKETLATLLDSMDEHDREIVGFNVEDVQEILGSISADFDPGTIEDQSRLDEKSPITCPECGHEFTK